MHVPLLLQLLAGFGYAVGALLIKRSADLGVGVWRTAFVANIVGAFLFLPLLAFGGTLHPELWWQPVIAGGCFALGQWLVFMSLDRGDVSVATPVLGLKILLVAVLVTALGGQSLRWQLWVAAVLATGGVVFLNQRGSGTTHHHVGRTILFAGIAAVVYAIFDVLMQTWTPRWGLGRFLPLAMGVSGLLSFCFVAQFRAPLSAIAWPTWRWLLAGTFVLGAQSVLFVSSLAHWSNAAPANVVYSSRGLWSIVLVWIVGHWVRSREQHLERRVLVSRAAGATLMMSAIVLVLWR